MASRGTLRIYLGASPGAGKTYKMLGEGARRKEPPKELEYRGTVLTEMDVDAIIPRRPDVVVDEFAHTNAPGSRNEKRQRWR